MSVGHRTSISEESSEWGASHTGIQESSTTISSSLTHSRPRAVQPEQTSQWDLHEHSPDTSHSPAMVASDQGPSNYPSVSSAQSTDTLLGTSSSMPDQTRQNALPNDASSPEQSSKNKSLRRSKRKVARRSSKSEGDQNAVEKLSKATNRKVKGPLGRSQVAPAKDERSVGQWDERVMGESEKPVLSNDVQQNLEGQIQTEGNESVSAKGQISTVKRKRKPKEKNIKLSKEGERAVKVSLREDERSANAESKRTTFGEKKTTQNKRAVKPENIVEREEHITMGNFERISADVRRNFGYDPPIQTSCHPRNCSADEGGGSEEGISLRAMASGAESLQCSDKTLNFNHRRNQLQLHVSNTETISSEDKGKRGPHDLIQRCHTEMQQNRARELGTSQHGSYSQPPGGIRSEVYQHKDGRAFQIAESEREILENKIESRSAGMHHTTISPYQERKSHRQQNPNCSEKETDMQQKDYSNYNVGQRHSRTNGGTQVKRKPLGVFNHKTSQYKTDLRKSYYNNGFLQYYLARDHQQLTRDSLRTLQLEQENSRLRKEVASLRAKLGEISDAVQRASDAGPPEAYTEDSDECEEEEEEEEEEDSPVEDDGEEYYSYDDARFPGIEGENEHLFRLYEAFVQNGGSRGQNGGSRGQNGGSRGSNMRQPLQSIRGKSCPRKTAGSITKRYRKNAGARFPGTPFRKTGNHPNMRSLKTNFFE
ncbi:uncharacterized protein LOC135214102 isoform X2 [Macrobrachium nipponense]